LYHGCVHSVSAPHSHVSTTHAVATITTVSAGAQVYKAFLAEADRLASTTEEQLPTTLLVLPDFALGDFEEFQAFAEWLEDDLEQDEVSLQDQKLLFSSISFVSLCDMLFT
jgi:hypothetical protein